MTDSAYPGVDEPSRSDYWVPYSGLACVPDAIFGSSTNDHCVAWIEMAHMAQVLVIDELQDLALKKIRRFVDGKLVNYFHARWPLLIQGRVGFVKDTPIHPNTIIRHCFEAIRLVYKYDNLPDDFQKELCNYVWSMRFRIQQDQDPQRQQRAATFEDALHKLLEEIPEYRTDYDACDKQSQPFSLNAVLPTADDSTVCVCVPCKFGIYHVDTKWYGAGLMRSEHLQIVLDPKGGGRFFCYGCVDWDSRRCGYPWRPVPKYPHPWP